MGNQPDHARTPTSTLILGTISWLAIVIIMLMILVYLRCENTDGRLSECAKAGRSRRDCVCLFRPDYACSQEALRDPAR